MEERIIDDEFGKGVRLKKNKDGDYVIADETDEAQDGEEVTFEFPTYEQDETDEDLVGLDPEEVAKILKQREEEAAARRQEYEAVCADGEKLLAEKDYSQAEATYEKALKLDDEPTEASVGYWKAKTAEFTNTQALLDEYEEIGVESMEYDLGYKAVEILKAEYKQVFEKEYAELLEEEKPLAEEVEGKQENRRAYLKTRLKKTTAIFALSALPLLVCLVLAFFFAGKIHTTPDGRYIGPTIAFALASVAGFIGFVVSAVNFMRALKIYGKNERLESTDAGARLVQIRLHKEIYEYLLAETEQEDEE